MDKQTAAAAVQFLQRLNLTGHEVPAFVAVLNALNAVAAGHVSLAAASPSDDLPGGPRV